LDESIELSRCQFETLYFLTKRSRTPSILARITERANFAIKRDFEILAKLNLAKIEKIGKNLICHATKDGEDYVKTRIHFDYHLKAYAEYCDKIDDDPTQE
jgi:hypothetical protein